VRHTHFQSLQAASDALRERLDELAPEVRRETIGVFKRQFEPVRQVVARAEISGPGVLRSAVHGGIDLRGDGSIEAYTGRLRRKLVTPREGESVYEALRRVLEHAHGG
jgi:hypothetical protein